MRFKWKGSKLQTQPMSIVIDFKRKRKIKQTATPYPLPFLRTTQKFDRLGLYKLSLLINLTRTSTRSERSFCPTRGHLLPEMPPAYTISQRQHIAQFVTLTQAKDAVAAKVRLPSGLQGSFFLYGMEIGRAHV